MHGLPADASEDHIWIKKKLVRIDILPPHAIQNSSHFRAASN